MLVCLMTQYFRVLGFGNLVIGQITSDIESIILGETGNDSDLFTLHLTDGMSCWFGFQTQPNTHLFYLLRQLRISHTAHLLVNCQRF